MTADPRHLIPPIHSVLGDSRVRSLIQRHGKRMVRSWIDVAMAATRDRISEQTTCGTATHTGSVRESLTQEIVLSVVAEASAFVAACPSRCINATGILLHTGLGRAPLSRRAVEALAAAAAATPIEVDPVSGLRAKRAASVRARLTAITGAEDALIVNNNAAATLLVLQALCQGTEVLISRGELVEIGGSFRLPDIFRLAGASLIEVGTTNRTRLSDYAEAITPRTSAILRVHPSNFRMVGFVQSPALSELADLARRSELLLLDDIGSGLLRPTRGFADDEPSFSESLTAGADVVLASADKLLGGPQAGLILGKGSLIAQIGRHPLARTVRTGKLTLAALAATLDAYLLNPESPDIPLLAMMRTTLESLQSRAAQLSARIFEATGIPCSAVETHAETGGGSLPAVSLDSRAIAIRVPHPDQAAHRLRLADHPVWARIQDQHVLLDLRSVLPEEDEILLSTVIEMLSDATV